MRAYLKQGSNIIKMGIFFPVLQGMKAIFGLYYKYVLGQSGTFDDANQTKENTDTLDSIYDSASLILTSSAGYKASNLYMVKPIGTSFDVTRAAATGTRINKAGVIETVAANVPRITWEGGMPYLLIEPTKTNVLLNSETLSTQNVTVTAAERTLSFYGTGSVVLSGAHSATLAGTGASDRVTLTFTPSAGTLTLTVSGSVKYAQLELGSPLTAYIPTTSASETRNDDIIQKTSAESLIGLTEGTLYMEVFVKYPTSTRRLFNLQNTSTSTKRIQFAVSSGLISAALVNTTVIHNPFKLIPGGDTYKVAYAYNNAGGVFYVNGEKISEVSFANQVPDGLSKISFDDGFGNVSANDLILEAALFKNRLTNAQLQTLTTL